MKFQIHRIDGDTINAETSGCETDAIPENVYTTLITSDAAEIAAYANASQMQTLIKKGDGTTPYGNVENIDWIDYRNENPSVKKGELQARILQQIQKVPEDGLYIFMISGHGGNNSDGTQHVLLKNGVTWIYDYQIWELFKQCKGRIFAIFANCHSGTMYREPGADNSEFRPFLFNLLNSKSQSRDAVIIEGYEGDIASSDYATYSSLFKKGSPVYVKLNDSEGVKMLAVCSSVEQGYTWAESGMGVIPVTVLRDQWRTILKTNVNATYKDLWDKASDVLHNKLDAQYAKDQDGNLRLSTAFVTFTDGFTPSAHKMFR